MNNLFAAMRLPAFLLTAGMLCGLRGQSANPRPSGADSANLPPGTAVVAELAKSIDAKKAKLGDMVKAKVVQDVLSNGQIIIHRGSKLLGRIIEARASGQEEPRSCLGVLFDRVSLKEGGEINFNAVLLALAPRVEAPDVLSSSSSAYGGGNPGGSQPVSRGASKMVVIDPKDRIDHTREDALQNASNPDSYGKTLNTLHNGFLGSGNRGVFGMPGVTLKSVPGANKTELISTKEDIKLENGTQMVVGVTGRQ